jgi:ATP-dependent Clp protease ATP-binding subunit ClpC
MVVQHAQEEARELGDAWVGTDHLLLAMLRDRQGAGAWLLDEFGVSYDAVLERIAPAIEPA